MNVVDAHAPTVRFAHRLALRQRHQPGGHPAQNPRLPVTDERHPMPPATGYRPPRIHVTVGGADSRAGLDRQFGLGVQRADAVGEVVFVGATKSVVVRVVAVTSAGGDIGAGGNHRSLVVEDAGDVGERLEPVFVSGGQRRRLQLTALTARETGFSKSSC